MATKECGIHAKRPQDCQMVGRRFLFRPYLLDANFVNSLIVLEDLHPGICQKRNKFCFAIVDGHLEGYEKADVGLGRRLQITHRPTIFLNRHKARLL